MAGLASIGNNVKTNALSGMRRLSDLERQREQEEKALDRQDKADRQSNQMSGAGLGAMAGAMMYSGNPYAMAAGAIIGFATGSLF